MAELEGLTDPAVGGLGWLDARSVLVGALAFLAALWAMRGRGQTGGRRRLPPGPRGWPLLGYLPYLALAKDDPHVVVSRLTKRYGNVISLNLAGNLLVVLHGHETIRDAFQRQQLSARPRLYSSEKIIPGVGIITSSGEVWTELRRFSMSVLRGLGVGKSSFEERISTEVGCLVEAWKRAAPAGGPPLEPRALVAGAVSNVICSVVFGRRFGYGDAAFRRLLRLNDDIAAQAASGGALEFSAFLASLTFLPVVRRYLDSLRRFQAQITSLVAAHRRDFDAGAVRHFIDAFLVRQAQAETRTQAKAPASTQAQMPEGQAQAQEVDAQTKVRASAERQTETEVAAYRPENLLGLVGDLFFAGSETTTTTLRWMLLYMAAHPAVQARVQAELDAVTGRNRFPRLADRPALPYTEAVLSELQRLNTIAPVGVPHSVLEDTELFGYVIPKGTVVISNLWHCHFDPSVWERPDEFRPERFLNDEGAFVSRKELIPFGVGRRSCLGEHLAKMEIFLFTTRLLHEFTFTKPPGSPALSLRGINGATYAPPEFKICAVPRA